MNNNELKVLHEQEVLGKQFKIYGDVNKPLFLAKDVAEFIEHSDTSKMVKSVDEDEKLMRTLFLSGQSREALLLTEDGVYEVLMQSRKPIAKQFKKKVKEILKTIRKTGGFVANDELFISTYLPFADEQTKVMFRGTLETVRKLNEVIVEKDKEIDHGKEVIKGLVEDISLADKRQILNRVVRKGGSKFNERWAVLYREFEAKEHCNIKVRMGNYNENNKPKVKNKLDYVDKVMNKLPVLYDIACKIYQNDVDILVKELYELNNQVN